MTQNMFIDKTQQLTQSMAIFTAPRGHGKGHPWPPTSSIPTGRQSDSMGIFYLGSEKSKLCNNSPVPFVSKRTTINRHWVFLESHIGNGPLCAPPKCDQSLQNCTTECTRVFPDSTIITPRAHSLFLTNRALAIWVVPNINTRHWSQWHPA